jgi:hypothetical protein
VDGADDPPADGADDEVVVAAGQLSMDGTGSWRLAAARHSRTAKAMKGGERAGSDVRLARLTLQGRDLMARYLLGRWRSHRRLGRQWTQALETAARERCVQIVRCRRT